jgi:hypothetical protein
LGSTAQVGEGAQQADLHIVFGTYNQQIKVAVLHSQIVYVAWGMNLTVHKAAILCHVVVTGSLKFLPLQTPTPAQQLTQHILSCISLEIVEQQRSRQRTLSRT